MQIGERLFNLRTRSDQSLQDVANAVGISKVHVWELEKGRTKKPSFELVRNLAQHFGVTTDELVGLAKEPDAASMQLQRIHRDLETLSERDRAIIEETVKAMKARATETA
ncbi:helix-turn-helix transcriptional regulator [Thalassovita sp.]|uniref:helix-turn-helix domain-containing protein n=1 Tax=Thalassovita sp. TaxID=1979401 RepID=UPI0029DE5749|nr:helix-turn-helix transcriptional regulator [Thalassovita sp.]